MVLRADVVGNVGGINIVWKRQDGRPIPSRHVQVSKRIWQPSQRKHHLFCSEGQRAVHPRGHLGGRRLLRLRGSRLSRHLRLPGAGSLQTSLIIRFQFVANLVIAEALQIKLEPQQQTVSVTFLSSSEGITRTCIYIGETWWLSKHYLPSCCRWTCQHCVEQARKFKTIFWVSVQLIVRSKKRQDSQQMPRAVSQQGPVLQVWWNNCSPLWFDNIWYFGDHWRL